MLTVDVRTDMYCLRSVSGVSCSSQQSSHVTRRSAVEQQRRVSTHDSFLYSCRTQEFLKCLNLLQQQPRASRLTTVVLIFYVMMAIDKIITRRHSCSSNPRRIAVNPNPNRNPNPNLDLWPFNPQTISGYLKILCTKFEHFGTIRFWVILRTNRYTYIHIGL